MKQIRFFLATLLAIAFAPGAWADYTSGYMTFSYGILTKIADGATTVVVPESYVEDGTTYTVYTVGINFLVGCTTLKSITFPKTFDGFNDSGATSSVFLQLSTLEEVIFDEDSPMEEIYQSTFYRCTNLRNVVFPNKLKTIGSNAFRYCSSLTSITLGENVSTIGTYAFGSCSNLKSVTIKSKSIVRAAPSAFSGLPSSRTLTVPYGMKSVYAGLPEWSGFTIKEASPLPGDVEENMRFNFTSAGDIAA